MICLAACGNQVYNINISDFDEAPSGGRAATVSLYTGYADGYSAGDIHHININNIHATQARMAVEIRADVRNISINNISQDNKNGIQMSVFPDTARRGFPFKIGMSLSSSVHAHEVTEATFRKYTAAGIRDLEISLDDCEANLLDYDEVVKMAFNTGVTIQSLHLPFAPFEEIDISKPELADYTVEFLSGLIRRAAKAGIKKFVIHPSGEPIADSERKERMECSKKSLKKLAELAREYGAIIAVENLPRTCLGRNSAEILELISADPTLRVCFDTNHLLKEKSTDFIKAVCKYITTTHISDYDFIDEKHFLPGEGLVDWQKLINDLIEYGYKGIWLYELNFTSTRIKRERPLVPEDYMRNATELFTGKTPTVLKSEIITK
jgi:sugar phosphate isomerase/epimerase